MQSSLSWVLLCHWRRGHLEGWPTLGWLPGAPCGAWCTSLAHRSTPAASHASRCCSLHRPCTSPASFAGTPPSPLAGRRGRVLIRFAGQLQRLWTLLKRATFSTRLCWKISISFWSLVRRSWIFSTSSCTLLLMSLGLQLPAQQQLETQLGVFQWG